MLFMEIYSLGNIDKSICNLYVCYKEVIFKVKIIKYMIVCYKVDVFFLIF